MKKLRSTANFSSMYVSQSGDKRNSLDIKEKVDIGSQCVDDEIIDDELVVMAEEQAV